MSKNEAKPLSRKAEIVIQEFNNEILIYDLTTHKAFSLNETSALVWQACDGSKTVGEISNHITQKLNSPITEDFVWLALEQLKKENLIENETEVASPFEGVSRREIIRRVGLATLVALPIVSSLIAPMAINAQSSTCGGTCQCPNATVSFCSPSVGALTNCNLLSPTATCRCRAPFAAPGSGTSPGQKLGNCAVA